MLLLAAAACGQETRLVVSGAPLQNSAQTADRVPEVPPGDIVREIDDPHNGDRWLLIRDSRHPGGPGLLRLVTYAGASSRQGNPELNTPAPIIHAGDSVIVEQSTLVMEARLEAIALGPAIAGSTLNLRLVLGGRVVRAVATGRNSAIYQGEAQR
jgi:hypothetical protein